MNVIAEIFEAIKEEVIKSIKYSTKQKFTFQTSLKIPQKSQIFPSKVLPSKDVSKKMLVDWFYNVSELSPLLIYIDDIVITYNEKHLYDTEIESHYFKYSKEWGGFPIIIPCILLIDLFCLLYNNILVFPYIKLRYMNNPAYYFFYVKISLRKTMVS